MKRIWFIMLFAMLILALNAYGQVEGINKERQSVTFSLAGINDNSVTAVTFGSPISALNGFGSLFLNRQTTNGEVTSEVLHAEIEGGLKYLEAAIEFTRDDHRGIAGEIVGKYMFTTGDLQVGSATLRGGAGNYTARTAVKKALGITDNDPVSFGFTSYLQLDLWKTRTVATAEPEIDFKAYQLEVESSIRHKLAENFEIGTTVKVQFDSDPITEDKVHSQYLVFATWLR